MSGGNPGQPQFELGLPRFDTALLNLDDPFELDSVNMPHLTKHDGCDPELLYSMWASDFRFFPATHGPADWFLVADIGNEVFFAALMPSTHSDHTKCRPIGLRRAPAWLVKAYFEAL